MHTKHVAIFNLVGFQDKSMVTLDRQLLKDLKLLNLKNGITWSTDMTLKVRIKFVWKTDCQMDEERKLKGGDKQATE